MERRQARLLTISSTENSTLRKKCPYSELLWSAFSRIWTEYSARMWENADQNKSEYRHFLRSTNA